MNDHRERDGSAGALTPRRRVLATAVPVLAGGAATALSAGPARAVASVRREPIRPLRTTAGDWRAVAGALGRPGNMMGAFDYHTAFLRTDLEVISDGVTVTPGLALGSHVGFVRYADGSSMVMGDLVATEDELQRMTDALQAHGFMQTAVHKHLLAHTPDLWWTHAHARGGDPVALARGLRAALDSTRTPMDVQSAAHEPVDLDTAGIDAALGVKGYSEDGVYKCIFVRRETITDEGLVLPPGLGSTSALNFQPLGEGQAAINGDLVMIADEVNDVLAALRQGNIDIVGLHNHALADDPRLFFTHFWAVGDAVTLARALRRAVSATNTTPRT
ncbi:DUF1259 domain-containing protein [Streptomyces sp. NPDC051994]|uniref:DUF1259 domain-containing protein n=1 Tax=unclassified Streptomyces TaxID=2593676 RepID=UPI003440B413